MQQPPLDQIIAELIESFGAALGLLAGSIATQTDAEKLHATLQAQLAAAKSTRAVPPLSIRLATHALAAVDAERLAQQLDKNAQAKH